MGLKRPCSAKGCEGNSISCIVPHILSSDGTRRICREFHEIPANECIHVAPRYLLLSTSRVHRRPEKLSSGYRGKAMCSGTYVCILMHNHRAKSSSVPKLHDVCEKERERETRGAYFVCFNYKHALYFTTCFNTHVHTRAIFCGCALPRIYYFRNARSRERIIITPIKRV